MLVQRAIPALLRGEEIPVKQIGRFWRYGKQKTPGVQIDLVIVRQDGEEHICECKWEARRPGIDLYKELIRKMSLYPYEKTLNPTLFVLAKPSKSLLELKREGQLWLYTLEDLYRIS